MLSVDLSPARIQHRLAGHSVTFAAVIFLTLFLIPNYASDRLAAVLFYIVLALASVLIGYLLFNGYQHARTRQVSIDLDAKALKVPRLLFPHLPRIVAIADITSVEELNVQGATNLVIGLKARHPIILEQSLCSQPNDLTLLKEHLTADLRRLNKDFETAYSASRGTMHTQLNRRELYIVVLIAALASAFYLSTNGLAEDTVSPRFVEIGATTDAILQNFELYRLFTSFFLHYNLAHLLVNFVLFALIGQFIVKILGPVRFLNIVLFSSMTAVLVSSCFIGENASFGASGGGFGLLGAYAAIKLRYKERLPALLNPMPNWVLALLLLLQLVVGLYYEVIDVNNHLGGFIAGFGYGFVIRTAKNAPLDRATRPEVLLLFAGVAAYAYGFVQLFGAATP